MSAQNPTPDDLRVLAKNLTSEGQTSRGEVIANTAEKLAALTERVGRLTEILKRVEWESNENVEPSCPICGRSERLQGHAKDCELAAALQEAQ